MTPVSGTTIANILSMETKLTPIKTILDLPAKSTYGSQAASSTCNSNNEPFAIGKKQNLKDDSFIKEQSDEFEHALKKKINIEDNGECKQDGPEDSEETNDQNNEVSLSPDQVTNVLAPDISEPIEQPAVQASISDTVDSTNTDTQVLAQPQDTTALSDNNVDSSSQVIIDTQTLTPQIEQVASDIASQQPTAATEVSLADTSQVEELDNTQLLENGSVSSQSEQVLNKPSDLASQINSQPEAKSTQVEDILTNTSQADSALLNENQQFQQESQTIVSDTLKQAEGLSQFKALGNDQAKQDQVKTIKNSQENTSQNSTKQNKMNPFIGTQPAEGTIDVPSPSDNAAFEVNSDSDIQVDVTSKIDDIQQTITAETSISTDSNQLESNRDVTPTQNIDNLAQSVAKQMQNSVNIALNRNQDQITVNLSPPELGRITIKLTENQSEVSGVLQVSKTQTRTEIENALPQIIRNLEQSGIQVKRIDVEVYDQNNINHQAPKDQGFQNDFSAQQDSQQNSSDSSNTANTRSENEKAYIAEKKSDSYQLGSDLGSGSINLFA